VRWTIYKIYITNFLRISHAKNHYNRLIFDRIIQKTKRWTFWGHGVEPNVNVVKVDTTPHLTPLTVLETAASYLLKALNVKTLV